MGIFQDIKEYPGSVPFYGFPVIPKFEDGIIIWEFPLGYAPNESQTFEIAKKLQEKFGGEIIETTETVVKVKPSPEKIGYVLYWSFLKK